MQSATDFTMIKLLLILAFGICVGHGQIEISDPYTDADFPENYDLGDAHHHEFKDKQVIVKIYRMPDATLKIKKVIEDAGDPLMVRWILNEPGTVKLANFSSNNEISKKVSVEAGFGVDNDKRFGPGGVSGDDGKFSGEDRRGKTFVPEDISDKFSIEEENSGGSGDNIDFKGNLQQHVGRFDSGNGGIVNLEKDPNSQSVNNNNARRRGNVRFNQNRGNPVTSNSNGRYDTKTNGNYDGAVDGAKTFDVGVNNNVRGGNPNSQDNNGKYRNGAIDNNNGHGSYDQRSNRNYGSIPYIEGNIDSAVDGKYNTGRNDAKTFDGRLNGGDRGGNTNSQDNNEKYRNGAVDNNGSNRNYGAIPDIDGAVHGKYNTGRNDVKTFDGNGGVNNNVRGGNTNSQDDNGKYTKGAIDNNGHGSHDQSSNRNYGAIPDIEGNINGKYNTGRNGNIIRSRNEGGTPQSEDNNGKYRNNDFDKGGYDNDDGNGNNNKKNNGNVIDGKGLGNRAAQNIFSNGVPSGHSDREYEADINDDNGDYSKNSEGKTQFNSDNNRNGNTENGISNGNKNNGNNSGVNSRNGINGQIARNKEPENNNRGAENYVRRPSHDNGFSVNYDNSNRQRNPSTNNNNGNINESKLSPSRLDVSGAINNRNFDNGGRSNINNNDRNNNQYSNKDNSGNEYRNGDNSNGDSNANRKQIGPSGRGRVRYGDKGNKDNINSSSRIRVRGRNEQKATDHGRNNNFTYLNDGEVSCENLVAPLKALRGKINYPGSLEELLKKLIAETA